MKASVLERLSAFKFLGNRKEKGKQPASNHALATTTGHLSYGSSAQTPRSGDVLERVEEVDDALQSDMLPWDSDQSGEEENWNDAEDGFVRDICAWTESLNIWTHSDARP